MNKTKTVRLQESTIKKLIEITKTNIGSYHGEMVDGRIQELCMMFEIYQRHNCEQIVAVLRDYNVTLVIKGESDNCDIPEHMRI